MSIKPVFLSLFRFVTAILVISCWLILYFYKMDDNSDYMTVYVKWNGKEYKINGLSLNDKVVDLKTAIQAETGVRPDRQKLLNIKHKGKPVDNDCSLANLNLKANFKIMMMGSLESEIEDAQSKPDGSEDVINDLDIEEDEIDIENSEIYLAKIDKRIREYQIKVFNEPRNDKKLLVLDIDYTLFDHRSPAETGYELMRPYLHEFLTSAYEYYDIVIWSATSMKWIEEKMKLLGVATHSDYKVLFYLDHLAMISVHTQKRGVIDVKPLGVIWGKYSQYSSKNTIMFDDVRSNFIMNPKSGLKIRPFRQAHLNRDKDKELLYLSQYLKDIATSCEDFNELNHKKWEAYKPPLRKSSSGKRKAEECEDSNRDSKHE